MADQAVHGPDLARARLIRVPGIEAMTVGAQHVRQHIGIAGVGARPTVPIPVTAALDHMRSDHIHLGVAVVPQEVDQQVVGRLQRHQAVGRRDAEFVPSGVQVQEAFRAGGDGQAGQDRTGLIHKAGLVAMLTAVNPEIYLHGNLLEPSGEFPRCGLGGRFPVRALMALHTFDGSLQQAWGTVLSGRSRRGGIGVLNPRPNPGGVDGCGTGKSPASSTPSVVPPPGYSNRRGGIGVLNPRPNTGGVDGCGTGKSPASSTPSVVPPPGYSNRRGGIGVLNPRPNTGGVDGCGTGKSPASSTPSVVPPPGYSNR